MTDDRRATVDRLLGEALERPPHERAAFLREACGNDETLRREVETLVAHDARAAGFMSLPAAAPAARNGDAASDMIGRRLGPYVVRSRLGAGGMGEVYRATDTNLARQVAIKVLPQAVASDTERLVRFSREARTLAALNHPHIATIYGLERHDGTTALVMELVEGPTLADRIAEGPIPLDDALLIAAQIAEALEAAHEQGIIHRDLKPANIKVRADGTVKVLDFGLAKALTPPGALASGRWQSPTITAPLMTDLGVILGTPAYMSPEQARGEAVDQRTDIWAFGCVLYEMMTARMAFGATTVAGTLAKVLEGHPDLEALPVATPPAIRRLVRRCLERSIKNRVQHIGDARADIADVRAGDPAVVAIVTSGAASRRPRALMWAATAIALVLAAGVGARFGAPRITSDERIVAPVRFEVPRVQGESGAPVNRSIAVSPDGLRIVYVTLSSLRVVSLTEGTDVSLPVAGDGPFFSPDGAWIAFFSSDGLQRMPVSGGGVETITRDIAGTERTFGGSWAPGGTVIISSGGRLLRVSVQDGSTNLLASPDTAAGEVRFAWPEFLPDGRSVLFTVLSQELDDARIAVIDLMTGRQKRLLQGGHAARYVPTGHLLYASGGGLHAVGFDLERLQTRGAPTPVEGVAIAETVGGFTANFDVSETGTLAYLPPAPPLLRTMSWVDRAGREEPIGAPPMAYLYPRISPDGTRVALDVGGANRDIWMWPVGGQGITKITHGPTEDLMPVWSPDSKRVFFASDREGGAFRVFSVAADGAGSERQEFAGPDSYMPMWMSTPEELIAAASGPGTRGGDVVVVTLGKERQARTLLPLEGQQGNAQVSPDRQWIAYNSSESGSVEVYIRPYGAVDQRREQISHGGGVQPLWGRGDSPELFYWDLKGTLKVVSLTLTPDFIVGTTRDVPLGDGYEPGREGAAWTYQVSPTDGRLLLFRRLPSSGNITPIRVTLDWFSELRRFDEPR